VGDVVSLDDARAQRTARRILFALALVAVFFIAVVSGKR
jgi:hypothetical protein